MRASRVIYFTIMLPLLLLEACGAGSGKDPNASDPLAQMVPYWANISYTQNGQTASLQPPFLTTQNIFADAATGSCTGNQMEIIFNGSYNPDKVSKLVLTGLTTTDDYSGNNFTFTACMAPGSASITITAYDKDGKAIRMPLTVSISAMTATKTLGYGSPRYPNTGFEVAAAAKITSTSSIGMGTIAGKTTSSTGNTGYTMETGFVNYVHEVSP